MSRKGTFILAGSLILVAALLVVVFVVWTPGGGNRVVALRFTSPPDPNMIPAFMLMEQGGLDRKGIKLEYVPSKGAEDMTAHLQRGDVDLALFSVPGGARLYAKGFKEIRLIGVHVWKAVYVVAGKDIKGWEDLKGKRILIAFRGGPPDIIARTCMKAAGYDPDKDFSIEYLPATQIKMLLLAGEADAAVFPEPHVSMLIIKSKGKLKAAIDLQKEFAQAFPDWKKEELLLGGLWAIASNAKGKEKAIQSFISAFKEANVYAEENPDKAGEITAKYFKEYFGGNFPAGAVTAALKSGRLHLEFREVKDFRPLVAPYLKDLKFPIPDEKIYY